MNTAKRAAQLLSTQNIRSFLDSAEAFLFDCDGKVLFFLIKKLFVLASDGELWYQMLSWMVNLFD